MCIKQKGFGVIELFLILVVIVALGLIGWAIWNRQQKPADSKNPATTGQEKAAEQTSERTTYKRTTVVPKDWKTFTNEEFGFSFSYPPTWEIRSNPFEASGVSNPKAFNVDFYPVPGGNPQYGLTVMYLDLDKTIKDKVARFETDNKLPGRVQLIPKTKYFLYDGHKAALMDITNPGNGTVSTQYLSSFYVENAGRLYEFTTGAHDDNKLATDTTLLTVLESLKLQ